MYGDPFLGKWSKVSALFSKIKFTIGIRFFVGARYMLVVIGKIEKSPVQCLEASELDFFSSRVLSVACTHLPGERDMLLGDLRWGAIPSQTHQIVLSSISCYSFIPNFRICGQVGSLCYMY